MLFRSSVSTGNSELDAIQFAIAPRKAVTQSKEEELSQRFEYLVIATENGNGHCYQLLAPDQPLSVASQKKTLEELRVEKAIVKVTRTDTKTLYEISVPMKPMKKIRATAGREYNFSLLVHDPDGTGVRDLGAVMNLAKNKHNPLSWSQWPGVNWAGYKPFDNKVEFGFCSSIH